MSRPLVIAHRGASGERPENTLSAFERAIAQHADMIEIDLHLSRDGVVVIHHDASLARLGGTGRDPATTRAAELARSTPRPGGDGRADPDAARRARSLRGPHGVQSRAQGRRSGARLRRNRGAGRSRRSRNAGCCSRMLFSSLRRPGARAAPEPLASRAAGRARLAPSAAADPRAGRAGRRGGDQSAYPARRQRTSSRRAHAEGLKVFPYTANDPAGMNRLLDCGVDGIITNHPERFATGRRRACQGASGDGLPPHAAAATRLTFQSACLRVASSKKRWTRGDLALRGPTFDKRTGLRASRPGQGGGRGRRHGISKSRP